MITSPLENISADDSVSVSRVLVIEHNPTIGRTAVIALKAAGYEAAHVLDGTEALAYAQEQFPDIVVLDICHMQAKCLEALAELRRLRPERKPIVLATSIYPISRSALKANGIAEFIQKPYDVGKLLSTVNECVADYVRGRGVS